MAYGVAELIDGVRQGRHHFLKHIDGITVEQATWKPYPQSKSIAETLDHLLWGDRASVQTLESGKAPDYTTVPSAPPAESLDELKAKLADSHAALVVFLEKTYAGQPLDQEVSYYGQPMSLGAMLAAIPCEEHYHAGQVAYIRQATDPAWDYYTVIYTE